MSKVLALAVAGALVFAAPAWADREHSNNNTSKKLRQAVTTQGILEHQSAFQSISDFTGGNRLSGTPGYDASADYVARQAEQAGLEVSRFEFDYNLDLLADYTPPVLSVTSGGPPRDFVPGIGGAQFGGDFGSNYGSQSTDITAPVWAIDLNIDPARLRTATRAAVRSPTTTGCPTGRSSSSSAARARSPRSSCSPRPRAPAG